MIIAELLIDDQKPRTVSFLANVAYQFNAREVMSLLENIINGDFSEEQYIALVERLIIDLAQRVEKDITTLSINDIKNKDDKRSLFEIMTAKYVGNTSMFWCPNKDVEQDVFIQGYKSKPEKVTILIDIIHPDTTIVDLLRNATETNCDPKVVNKAVSLFLADLKTNFTARITCIHVCQVEI